MPERRSTPRAPGSPLTPGALTSRRGLLRAGAGTLGGLALGGLAGCGTSSGGGADVLDYWHLLSGADGERMQSMVADYNSRSDTRVKQTVLAWGPPYYTKLAMSSAGGRAPDLAVMHGTRVPGFAQGRLLDAWDKDVFAELDVSQDKFPKRIWSKGVVEDSLYAVALDTHPFVIHYNTEIAEKAGALGSDGLLKQPDSPEAFRDMAEALTKASPGKHGLSFGYLGDGAQMWRMFYTWYTQTGATIKLPQGGTMQYDKDAAIRALEWIKSLIDGKIGNRSHDGGTAYSEFATGESAMLFSGVWDVTGLKNEGVPFDTTLIPPVFGRTTAYGDSHAFVLPHQDNPDPDARRKAHEFVADTLKHSLQWAKAGHIPAYTPVTEKKAYENLVPQSHYQGAVEHLVYDPEAWFTGSGTDFQNFFRDSVQQVLLGDISPERGLTAFERRINDLLSRPSPVQPSQ